MNSYIVAIEGPNRAGKSTLLQRLPTALRQHGYRVRAVDEFDCPVGRANQEVLARDDLTPDTKALLHAAVRLDSLRQNQRLLDQGTTLLYDRYLWSTFAYYSARCAPDYLLSVNLPCRRADYNVVLDADPQKLLERQAASKLGQHDVDDLQRQELVRAAFLDMARSFPRHAAVVDALQDPDETLDATVQVIQRFLDRRQKMDKA